LEPGSGHVECVVDKVAVWQIFSEYFGFLCQFSFHRLLHIHYHHLSSGTGTIGQLVADVTSGLSLTPPQETKKNQVISAVTLKRNGGDYTAVHPVRNQWTVVFWIVTPYNAQLVTLLGLLFYPEDGGSIFFRNVVVCELYGITTQKTMCCT
jgi:hypothetical protein